jgi:hypothetical protein
MGKIWTYKTQFGSFVITQKESAYDLFFHEQFGDVVRMHHSEDLPEILSFLLTTKRIKTENAVYTLDVSKLGIPSNLDNWDES